MTVIYMTTIRNRYTFVEVETTNCQMLKLCSHSNHSCLR